jgi:hypothetical protein
VVNVELADVNRLEVTVLAVVLTVDRVWISEASIDCVAFVPVRYRLP